MVKRRLRVAQGSIVAMAALCSASAMAQSTGFSLDRFEPSERGSEWFTADSLDLRGKNRLTLGVVADYAYKPLVFYKNGAEDHALVKDQLFLHVGGSIVLADRWRLALSLPVLAHSTGTGGTVGGVNYAAPSGSSIGDLRLSVDYRLLGEYRSPFTLAAGVSGFAPTGSRDTFAGDGKVRIVPHVLAATELGSFVASAKLGVQYRAQDAAFAGTTQGTEVVAAAAAGFRSKDGKLVAGPELAFSTVVTKGDAIFARRTTPFEVLMGAHYLLADQWRLGAGVGPGLSRGLGSPEVRVVGVVEWAPQPEKKAEPLPPSDRDYDGIFDDSDACIDVPGVVNADPKKHGCPLPLDRDHDGIFDVDDACIDEPGVASSDPAKNGCPLPKDADKDGILDVDDACVNEPGVASSDPKKHGCPLPKDTDGDKILDPDDACVNNPGEPNSDPKKHGCPKVIVTETAIQIMERVEFDTGKATLLKSSEPILIAVLGVLKDNPRITRLSVEGHTDSRADDNFNLGLSRRRAATVVKWLVDHGIDAKRLSSQGFGETKPVESNDTETGRQNNRRVEFHILEEGGKSVDPARSSTTEKKTVTKEKP